MTHRDRAGDPSGQRAGRREAAGDAGHRQGFPTPAPIHPLPVRPRDRNGDFLADHVCFTPISRPSLRNPMVDPLQTFYFSDG